MTTPTPHGAPELPEAKVRAIMASAGFSDNATAWSGGVEEMRHVIRTAAEIGKATASAGEGGKA